MDFKLSGSSKSHKHTDYFYNMATHPRVKNAFPFSAAPVRWLITVFILFIACSSNKPPVKKPELPSNINYLDEIKTREEFDALKGAPLDDKYADDEAIKIIYDIRAKKLYFIQSEKYMFHYAFCSEVLHYGYDLGTFNTINYASGAGRQYLIGTLDYFSKAGLYVLEFSGLDISNSVDIRLLFDEVKKHTFFGNELKLLVNSSNLLMLKYTLQDLPLIYPDVLFGGQTYQGVSEGTAYGYLRRFDDLQHNMDSVEKTDILLIHENPDQLPLCAGIITTINQTPLSHINILVHNRGTPCMVLVNGWENAFIDSYLNQPVKLFVSVDSFSITPATDEEVRKYAAKAFHQSTSAPKSDITYKRITDIQYISKHSAIFAGSKAANFGELNRLASSSKQFNVPEGGFVIPFYYYFKHVHQKEIDSLIHVLQTNPQFQTDNELLSAQLKKIRKAIKDAPIDQSLLKEVENKIKSGNAGSRYRFRSSTNAEDIKGFNGAGLYDSKTGIPGDSLKSVESAIKAVWASIYSYQAYKERAAFGINQSTVYMGILVHRSFPDEIANGVAVTTNLYRSYFPGFTVNVQKGEISVVSPEAGIVCDQFVVFYKGDIDGSEDTTILTDYITMSNQNNGEPVLNDYQTGKLYQALLAIKNHYFYSNLTIASYYDFALDVEFKFDANGKLYIKQVRPY